ncbi:PD-(D/E)XK motif protein [Serinicoccus kebangsaanensis]|uniref:PD-(D/E)XK motif protein n=1 Tax=Serinicoccus kebangsaanensis TaxID=2602069 RepID=UPI00124DA20F|nr:PD-(D/E)XK motif protein [Serinicoccus kebangsaanensis]
MPSYEEILTEIDAVPATAVGGVRDIHWTTPDKVIGIARDQAGRLELFLAGAELKAASRTVRESLEHHEWHRKASAPLHANRLVLPALGHFDPVAAFICANLLRNGADEDVEHAFRVTEPIIELAIERLLLSETALLGLLGELLLLNSMCHLAQPYQVGSVVLSWDGWRRSSRDFHWNGTGVELKTTTRSTSSHMVQGVHQIEPSEGEDGISAENRLLLVSVGLQRASEGLNSISVPDLVQRIVNRLEITGNASEVPEFLTRISRYGSESGFGYDHTSMQHDAPFTSNFTVAFFRGYDMADPGVEILRRDDVARRHHVEIHSVAFRVNLPASISGTNPINGANQVAASVLEI